MWNRLWASPQAVAWEQLGQEHLVGLYVRRLVEAEAPGAKVTLSTLVRQMADSLGLTVAGMRTNRWRIVQASAPSDGPGGGPGVPSSRSRLRVVDGEGGGAS